MHVLRLRGERGIFFDQSWEVKVSSKKSSFGLNQTLKLCTNFLHTTRTQPSESTNFFYFFFFLLKKKIFFNVKPPQGLHIFFFSLSINTTQPIRKLHTPIQTKSLLVKRKFILKKNQTFKSLENEVFFFLPSWSWKKKVRSKTFKVRLLISRKLPTTKTSNIIPFSFFF